MGFCGRVLSLQGISVAASQGPGAGSAHLVLEAPGWVT
jgi:hypothetical protein